MTVAVGTPTSVTLSAPARLVYAQHGSVTAVAKVAGVVKAGVSVSFQWLPAGATAWTVKGSVLTDATGTAKFTTPVVTTTGRWRVVVTGPGLISSNASATAPTVLVPLINASPTSLTLKKGGKATISAGFAPTTSNQRILLQRRVGTGWVAVATLVTSARSIVRYAAPTTSIGTRTYRCVSDREARSCNVETCRRQSQLTTRLRTRQGTHASAHADGGQLKPSQVLEVGADVRRCDGLARLRQ